MYLLNSVLYTFLLKFHVLTLPCTNTKKKGLNFQFSYMVTIFTYLVSHSLVHYKFYYNYKSLHHFTIFLIDSNFNIKKTKQRWKLNEEKQQSSNLLALAMVIMSTAATEIGTSNFSHFQQQKAKATIENSLDLKLTNDIVYVCVYVR